MDLSATIETNKPADFSAISDQSHLSQVAFIDTNVSDWQTLVESIPTGIEVVLLDGQQDGVLQMAEWAKTHSGYDAIHLLSHDR